MKVFISHTFADKDKELSSILQRILAEKEIQGYLAEEKKEYDLLIRDKIMQEIVDSDYIVAIVTNNAKESASVNQELGYALGKDKSIIIMNETEAKIGVLTHGIETEEFTRENFEERCKKIRSHILEKGSKQKTNSEYPSSDFLLKRNLLDETLPNFGMNVNSEKLKTPINDLNGNEKPFVLFSTCPKFLLKELQLMSKQFSEWLDTKGIIKIKGNEALFLRGYHTRKPDLDNVTYEFKNNYDGIMRYLELNQNGFVEHGMTIPVIYSDRYKNGTTVSVLNLFSLTGAFWAFVIFCKQYYDFIGFEGDVEIRLSIHNSKELTLMGFGGKTSEGDRWLEPNSTWWNEEAPSTTRQNILLTTATKVNMLSDDYIENKVREISNKLANAYGLEYAMCYDSDGNFNFNSDRGTIRYY